MAKTKKMNISVFFPAYNEGENIAGLATKTASVLKKIADKWEVIVVNDGSADNTAEVVNNLHKKEKRIRLVDHVVNQGYGAAVKSGFKAAKLDWIFFTDGDAQFDVAEMEDLVGLLADNDLVIGYRIDRADPLQRKINAWAWGTLVKAISGLRGVRDIDCAFKFIRREVFSKFELETTGAMISTELLVKCQRHGYRIVERGVHHYPRVAGEQTGARLAVIARAFKELFVYFAKWKKEPWWDSQK